MKNQLNTMSKTLNMTQIALFIVIMAICSWISIPTLVPFTLQTFGVFLAIVLLGGKKAAAVIILYLVVGSLGLPVFAGGMAGIVVVIGTNGGYMLGWIFQCLFMWFMEKFCSNSRRIFVFSMIIGLFICYIFGTVWFMAIYAKNTGSIGWITAVGWCVIPFVIPDFIKLFLALAIEKRIGSTVKSHK